jgi:hypothetical protein
VIRGVEPTLRYLYFSYSDVLTKRDYGRFKNLITSEIYRTLWGDRFRQVAHRAAGRRARERCARAAEGAGRSAVVIDLRRVT